MLSIDMQKDPASQCLRTSPKRSHLNLPSLKCKMKKGIVMTCLANTLPLNILQMFVLLVVQDTFLLLKNIDINYNCKFKGNSDLT